MRNNLIFKLITSIFFLFCINSYAQKKIDVQVDNLPLSKILNDIGTSYNVRFAFDDDLFSQIITSFHLNNIDLNDFLIKIGQSFGLNNKLIAGTYVFFIDDEMKMIEAINTSIPQKPIIEEKLPMPAPTEHEYTVSGIVTNLRTNDKIKYCVVQINNTETATTNEMGYFSKTLISDAELHFNINYIGYRPFDTIITIQNSMLLEFKLEPIPLLDPIVNFKFKRIDFTINLPDVPEMVVFNPQSTIQIPSVESNDLVNALIIIPGINYLKGTDTGLSIRGGAPSDNLVLLDGIPMIETNHLMGNLSVLNSKYIQQAFVSRGGFGAEYGGRTSGIVDLTGKSGDNKAAVVDFTANLLHTNIYVGIPVSDKSSIAGSFKKSFVDIWPQYLIDNFALENKSIAIYNDLTNENYSYNSKDDISTKINYSDINFKVSLRPSDRKEITLNFFNSLDFQKRDYNFIGDGGYYQKNFNNSKTSGYSINLKTQSRYGWLNTISVGYNKQNSIFESENGKSTEKDEQIVRTFFDEDHIDIEELRAIWKSELNNKYISHKFGAGYNYNSLYYNYEDHEYKIVGANSFNDSISLKSQIQHLNAYYQAELLPFKWLRARLGVRSLYHLLGGIEMQPRYGIEIIPSEHLKFHFASGRYLQYMYLTYRIDSYKNASPIWVTAKNNNQYLNATHNILGVRIDYKNFLFNVEGYNKLNSGKNYYVGNNTVRDGLAIVDYYSMTYEGEELNRGVDMFIQFRTSIFKHLISYSLSESKEKINGINNGEYFYSFDHQKHRLRLTEVASYRGWTASVNWYFANGMPFLTDQSTSNFLQFGLLNNYNQLDVSLVKQIDFKFFYADVGVSILNVMDYMNKLSVKNYTLPEGKNSHNVNVTTTATSFSPLFYINLRYE